MVMEEAQRWAGCWKKEVGIKLPVELSSKAKEVQVKKASRSVCELSVEVIGNARRLGES